MRRSFLTALSGAALLALNTPAWAQLTDLQPGRNFPTAQAQFGLNRSENVDVGDVDLDGDYDVIIGNGGDFGPEPNRIFINNGGIQGGTLGTWTEGTATRFAGVPNDTSRDIEFLDAEDDGDLDVYVANRGGNLTGEVSRFYRNLGGAQGGAVGFYNEQTNGFWGSLISVPAGDQVNGGNLGPWRDWSCDCEFQDLDLDGDDDLFHSSYGPNIDATRDSRLFINVGRATGVFDELWPWINAGGDIRTHTLDIDLIDLDGDYDLDVSNSSRNSQARIYRNNLNLATRTFPSPAFTDITQTALINQGIVSNGNANYEGEVQDLDGDGDIDIWFKNWNGNTDRIMRNNGNLTFTQMNVWIQGDPVVDENEIDFLDYDGDGDLDAYAANFSGTNWLYQGGLAQGLNFNSVGLFHRTGLGSGLAPGHELPSTNNAGTTLDGECADMDNDGDPDILVANDGNQQNRYQPNSLGIPDTHAPTIHQMTTQGNKADGSDTHIIVQLRDNASYYVVTFYDVDLIYTVNGGIENRVRMFGQGGMQHQGTIPGGINGAISYRVEGRDDAGNTFVSSTVNYTQTASGVTLLENVDDGTAGVFAAPFLTKPYFQLGGAFTGGSTVTANLIDAGASKLAILFFSLASSPLPFKGGLLHTVPAAGQVDLVTNAGGQIYFSAVWPVGLPTGAQIWYQYAIADSINPTGAVLSNAVKNTLP